MSEGAADGRETEVPLPSIRSRRTLEVVVAPPMARTRRRAGIALLMGFLVGALGAPAAAETIDEAGPSPMAVRRGDCTGRADWRLVVRRSNLGTLRVRLVITGSKPGHAWSIFMDHNGEGFFAGSRVARDTGVLEVRRRTDDGIGVDRIRFTARNRRTLEECRGWVPIRG